mgnify:CR=1 FL=1
MDIRTFKSPAEIALALLQGRPVTVPAYRDCPARTYSRQDVIDAIPERELHAAAEAALIDPAHAGMSLHRAMHHAAARLGRDLHADWCEEDAA